MVLPGSVWCEDEGTTTNLEGRVIKINRAAGAPGEARHDWEIFSALARRLGRGQFFPYRTVREVLSRDSAAGTELLDRLREPKSIFGGDDRLGLILIALGAAMIVFGLLQGSSEARQDLAPASVFPLFVGIVLVGRHFVGRTREAGR